MFRSWDGGKTSYLYLPRLSIGQQEWFERKDHLTFYNPIYGKGDSRLLLKHQLTTEKLVVPGYALKPKTKSIVERDARKMTSTRNARKL
jgi:hypothetical protein